MKQCTSCLVNHTLVGGTCYEDHCSEYDGLLCKVCYPGYTVENGKCTGCNCKLGFNPSGLYNCDFNSYIHTNICPGSSLIIPFCKVLQITNGDYVCVECGFGYTNENGICMQRTKNCNSYNFFSKCIVCKNSYLLTPESTCIPQVYYCQNYNSDLRICQKCLDGYILVSS